MNKITYCELKTIFCNHELQNPEQHLTAHIVFSQASFAGECDITSCTYAVNSYNKAFRPNMSGYSIFGSCLDGKDNNVRLEAYMAAERGGESGWKVDYCYIVEPD